LLDTGRDGPRDRVSDRFVVTLINPSKEHVEFGSDPNLPNIPDGAEPYFDFPVYEDGTRQLVDILFITTGLGYASFYIQSEDISEPSTLALLVSGFAGLGIIYLRWPRSLLKMAPNLMGRAWRPQNLSLP
jgi:hypothetical protein